MIIKIDKSFYKYLLSIIIFFFFLVPLTPRPIPNIIPPNGNSTNSTTALPEAEQVFIINCSYKYHLSIYKYAYNLLQT